MSTELAIRGPASLFPSEGEWKMLKEQASMVVKTGFLPRAVDTAEKAITIALKGRELGIPPMQAFSHIHIIQGKPTISAELMLSLIYKNCPGAVVNYVANTDKKCIIEAKRPGHKAVYFSYSIDEAQKAGLLSKDSWKNYPAAMLRARTVSIVARAQFPDAVMGCSYIPEELGADVNDEGEVVTLPVTEVETKPIAPMEPKPSVRTRNAIGAEIMSVARDLLLTKEQVEKWAHEDFGKSSKELTISEMEMLLGTLQAELGSKGESA